MKHVLLKLNAEAGYALVYLPENGKSPFAWVWGYGSLALQKLYYQQLLKPLSEKTACHLI